MFKHRLTKQVLFCYHCHETWRIEDGGDESCWLILIQLGLTLIPPTLERQGTQLKCLMLRGVNTNQV